MTRLTFPGESDNTAMSLGKIYTLTEVAEYLRMTNRGVAKIARAHGLCMVAGRTMTFTKEDIEGIKRAMRVASSKALMSHHNAALAGSASAEVRKLVLQRSRRPSHQKILKAEFGEE